MRPDPIVIPGIDIDAFARQQDRQLRRYGFARADDAPPVLAGLATSYYRPFVNGGKVKMLAPGCFSDSLARSTICFQLDHEGATCFDDTRGALELFDNDEGLHFRLPLDRVRNGSVLKAMVEANDRAAVSVSYLALAEHVERFGEHDVTIIRKADLQELSLVRRGAVEHAFAFLTNERSNPTVRNIQDSTVFKLSRMVDRLGKAQRDYHERIAILSARLDRLEAKAEADPEARAWALARNCVWKS